MTEPSEVVFDLLKEIKAACDAASCPYSLVGLLGRNALTSGKIGDGVFEASVAIPRESAASVASALEEMARSEHVVVRGGSRDTGIAAPFYLAAENTTYIDYVTMNAPGISGLRVKVIPSFAEAGCVIPLDSTHFVTGKTAFFDCVFDCALDHGAFKVSSEFRRALFEMFGVSWKKAKWPFTISKGKFGSVMDAGVPYRIFLEGLSIVKEGETGSVNDDWQALRSLLDGPAKERAALAEKDSIVFERTEQRYRLSLKYVPHKDRIIKYWSEGRYSLVAAALSDYTSMLKKHYEKSGVALYFDEDLFGIAVAILDMSHYAEADSLRAAIPPEHLLPLRMQ